jgi:hypothetical protein
MKVTMFKALKPKKWEGSGGMYAKPFFNSLLSE